MSALKLGKIPRFVFLSILIAQLFITLMPTICLSQGINTSDQRKIPQIKRLTDRLSKAYLRNTFRVSTTQNIKRYRSLAKLRLRLLYLEMKFNPGNINNVVFNPKVTRRLIAARVPVERSVKVHGIARRVVVDNTDLHSKEEFLIQQKDNKTYQLSFTDNSPIENINSLEIKDGIGIRLRTQILVYSDKLSLKSLVENESSARKAIGFSTTKKVGIILAYFSNQTLPNITTDNIKSLMFTNNNSVREYLEESSYEILSIAGKLAVDGDTFGWYQIPMTDASCDLNYNNWSDSAYNKAVLAGVDLSGYDHLMYIFPNISACSWAGRGELGGSITWINYSPVSDQWNSHVMIHELGHNLGFHHASNLQCLDSESQSVSISSNCSSAEYSDGFDPMGGSNNQFQGFNKIVAGWIPLSELQTIGTGNHNLGVLEQSSPSYPRVLRILRPGATAEQKYLYLEYRQPNSTFDNFSVDAPVVNGVTVRTAGEIQQGLHTYSLDSLPGAYLSAEERPVLVGNSFYDYGANIRIDVLSVSSTHAVVNVANNISPCQVQRPSIELLEGSLSGNAGEEIDYTLVVKNNSAAICQAQEFILAMEPPAGWSGNFSESSVTLAPGTQASVVVNLVSANNSAIGPHEFRILARNATVPGIFNRVTGSLSIPPPIPTDLSLTLLNSSVILTWNSNSSEEVYYIIQRKVGNDDFTFYSTAYGINQVQAQDFGIQAGYTYTYRVYAIVNSVLSSSPTNEASIEINEIDLATPSPNPTASSTPISTIGTTPIATVTPTPTLTPTLTTSSVPTVAATPTMEIIPTQNQPITTATPIIEPVNYAIKLIRKKIKSKFLLQGSCVPSRPNVSIELWKSNLNRGAKFKKIKSVKTDSTGFIQFKNVGIGKYKLIAKITALQGDHTVLSKVVKIS